MREQYYLRHSDRVAQTLNCIAQLKNKQGDEAKAEETLIETLTIRREISTERTTRPTRRPSRSGR